MIPEFQESVFLFCVYFSIGIWFVKSVGWLDGPTAVAAVPTGESLIPTPDAEPEVEPLSRPTSEIASIETIIETVKTEPAIAIIGEESEIATEIPTIEQSAVEITELEVPIPQIEPDLSFQTLDQSPQTLEPNETELESATDEAATAIAVPEKKSRARRTSQTPQTVSNKSESTRKSRTKVGR